MDHIRAGGKKPGRESRLFLVAKVSLAGVSGMIGTTGTRDTLVR
jgi:hypothetical protein